MGACPRYTLPRPRLQRQSGKKFVAKLQARDQRVDLFGRVVKPERGAAGRGDTKMRQQRHGAMRAGPHRDAALVEHGRDVMGMGRPFQREREEA